MARRGTSSGETGGQDTGAGRCGTLAVVFGDQLDISAPLLAELDQRRDVVLMTEVAEESRHVASHIQRTVLFVSAMRHFAGELTSAGFRVRYVRLDDPANTGTFTGEIERAAADLRPQQIACTRPGEWRVLGAIEKTCRRLGLPLRLYEDQHFLTSPEEFAAWAAERTSLTMEFFYREQRRKTGYLMIGSGVKATPEGGAWNFDSDNRESFGRSGPRPLPPPVPRFAPDAVTLEAIASVRAVLPDLPGRLAHRDDFGWPVTREQGREALASFINDRLALFGRYQDAMWTSEPTTYHSLLSPLLNLKLLNPRECSEAAIAAYRQGRAPLSSVEAFIRQIIGWREFIRGVYWLEGPGYAGRNGLRSDGKLPEFYWTGETDMNCMRHCIQQVLGTSYGHHIQRLMVTGNFALISGVHPRAVSDWYLGMFADGVDWVTLPNALGMVMHADARLTQPPGQTGLVGTKPYAASGKYIQRMSNYCRGCAYDPGEREGERACPFTVFYWDFLIRHRQRFALNQRMKMILKNIERMSPEAITQITVDARLLRRKLGISDVAVERG